MTTTGTFEAELVEALREFAEAMDGHTPAEIAAVVGKMLADGILAERERCARIAETSAFGEHETGAKVVAWSDAQARSRRLGHLIAEAIRTSPEHVAQMRELSLD